MDLSRRKEEQKFGGESGISSTWQTSQQEQTSTLEHPFINISGLLQKDDVQARVERSFLYNPEEAKKIIENTHGNQDNLWRRIESSNTSDVRALQSLGYTIHQDP